MSVRSEKSTAPMASPADQMSLAISEAQPTDAALQEGAAFNTANAENPLTRNVVISVRASLNELCLQKSESNFSNFHRPYTLAHSLRLPLIHSLVHRQGHVVPLLGGHAVHSSAEEIYLARRLG